MHAALDSGITAFDTAPVYGFGRAEEILGRALSGGRPAFLAGKCGLTWDGSGQFFFEAQHEGQSFRVHKNLSAEAVIRDCECSLERLKRDRIDLYQIHWPLSAPHMDEAYEALFRLRDQGKIGGVGICNATAEHLASFERSTGKHFDSVQNRLSLVHRSGSSDTLAFARKHRIAFLAYGALAQGALVARPSNRPAGDTDLRLHGTLFGGAWQERIAQAWQRAGVEQDERFLLALGYPLSCKGVSAVIAGIRNETQARQNARAGERGFMEGRSVRLEEAFGGLDYKGK